MKTKINNKGKIMKIMDTKAGDVIYYNNQLGIVETHQVPYLDEECMTFVLYGFEESESGLTEDREFLHEIVEENITVEVIGFSKQFQKCIENGTTKYMYDNLDNIFKNMFSMAMLAQKYEYLNLTKRG